MHDNHKHHTGHLHADETTQVEIEALRRLQTMIEHWIEHGDSHAENYKEWAAKASAAGEEEIAKEIHFAVNDSESAKKHLQRARAILAAKLVLKK